VYESTVSKIDPNYGARRLEAERVVMERDGAPSIPVTAPFVVNGITVLLRTLTAERRVALAQWRRKHPTDRTGFGWRVIAASVVNDADEELLTVEQVGALDMRVVEALGNEIVKRNHMR
jgi:hypothetical protein